MSPGMQDPGGSGGEWTTKWKEVEDLIAKMGKMTNATAIKGVMSDLTARLATVRKMGEALKAEASGWAKAAENTVREVVGARDLAEWPCPEEVDGVKCSGRWCMRGKGATVMLSCGAGTNQVARKDGKVYCNTGHGLKAAMGFVGKYSNQWKERSSGAVSVQRLVAQLEESRTESRTSVEWAVMAQRRLNGAGSFDGKVEVAKELFPVLTGENLQAISAALGLLGMDMVKAHHGMVRGMRVAIDNDASDDERSEMGGGRRGGSSMVFGGHKERRDYASVVREGARFKEMDFRSVQEPTGEDVTKWQRRVFGTGPRAERKGPRTDGLTGLAFEPQEVKCVYWRVARTTYGSIRELLLKSKVEMAGRIVSMKFITPMILEVACLKHVVEELRKDCAEKVPTLQWLDDFKLLAATRREGRSEKEEQAEEMERKHRWARIWMETIKEYEAPLWKKVWCMERVWQTGTVTKDMLRDESGRVYEHWTSWKERTGHKGCMEGGPEEGEEREIVAGGEQEPLSQQ